MFRGIALELYIGAFPTGEVLPWVETAAKELGSDMEDAQRRLDGILRILDEQIEALRIGLSSLTGPARDEKEKNLRHQVLNKGWTLYCLARSAQHALKSGRAERWRSVVLDASSKASAAFEECGDTETRDRLAKALHA